MSPSTTSTDSVWHSLLDDFSPPTPLPPVTLSQPTIGYRTDENSLSEVISAALRRLGEQHTLSLPTFLYAAWAVTLSRFTGEEDIVFGVAKSAEPLPLRVRLQYDQPLKHCLRDLQHLSAALEHAPAISLADIRRWHDLPADVPLFESVLCLETSEAPPLDYPLVLTVYQQNGLQFKLRYDTTRLDAGMVAHLLRHFKAFLTTLATHTLEETLRDLPTLSAMEAHKMLIEWNDTTRPTEDMRPVHHQFEAQAARTPDAIAVEHEGQRLTYADLNRRANHLAHYLTKRGIGPDLLVGICMERSLDMIVSILGVLKAGGAYLPLDPIYPPERLAFMLSDSYAAILLTETRLLDLLPPYEGKLICLDRDWHRIQRSSAQNPVPTVTPNNLAYIIYTSGSTGQPKGVMIEHASLSNFVEVIADEYSLTAEDRVLQFASISFDASVEEIFPTLAVGATVVLRSDEMIGSELTFWHTCREQAITVLDLPTAFWHQLVTVNLREMPSCVRLVVIGGEKINPEAVSRWLAYAPTTTRLLNTYGPTEATVVTTIEDLSAQKETDLITIGRPAGNVQVYVLSRYMQPMPVGVPGEVHLSGPGLARGYINQSEMTDARFIHHTFTLPGSHAPLHHRVRLYKTGDLARYLPDGRLEFLGRSDKQVKVRGFRIELGEIEQVLHQHPTIREAVVALKTDASHNEHLTAYLVPKADTSLKIGTLREYLKEKLPVFMLPTFFVTLKSIPLTPNGKINHAALPAPDLAHIEPEDEFVAPCDELEYQLLKIWEELLGVSPIGVRDNFFTIGGNSILAVQLFSQIQTTFNIKPPLATLFQAPTVEQFAEVLRQEEHIETDSPLVRLQAGRTRPPFFCIPGNLGNVFTDLSALARHLGAEQPFYGLQDGMQNPSKIEALAAYYLKEVRAVQPDGPYYLGGVCSGAVIAYEMAQQLHAQGEQTALLAMIEPSAPQDDVSLRSYIDVAADLFGRFVKRFGLHSRRVSQLSSEEQDAYVRLRTKLVANLWALAGYLPQPYPGHLDIFMTWASLNKPHNPQLDWKDFTSGGWQIHRIPGTHDMVTGDNDTEIDEEAMRVIAAHLRTRMDAMLRQAP